MTFKNVDIPQQKDYLLEVAKGNIPGAFIAIVRGHNPDIDSASGFEDIWEAGGSLVKLTSAETMEIVSTDTNDTSAGTGARTVLINGCDGTGATIEEIVTMNGTTNVTTTASFTRVNIMTVLTAGSSDFNEGSITATATTAGTVQCQMDTSEGISQNSHYCIPLGKVGFSYKLEINVAKISGGGSPILEFKGYAQKEGGARIQIFDRILDTSLDNSFFSDAPLTPSIDELTDIWLVGDSDSNNTQVRTGLFLLIEDK